MLYFGGPDVLLDICLGAYVLRMLLYAALPMFGSLWWIMPIELLHGLTFACGFGAACEKVASINTSVHGRNITMASPHVQNVQF